MKFQNFGTKCFHLQAYNNIACAIAIATLILFLVNRKSLFTYTVEQVSTHSRISTKSSSILGNTRFLSIAVPSPTGRRIFHLVLTWGRTSMEDHSPMRRWRTPRQFLRILPLLLCLYGYHLAGDGYSAPEQLPEDQLSYHYQYCY